MVLSATSSEKIFPDIFEKSRKKLLTNEGTCANITESLRDGSYMGEWWNW